jgi:hypothetical protein
MSSRTAAGCFSLRTIATLAVIFSLFVACVAYAFDYRAGLDSRVGNALIAAVLTDICLAMVILLIHASYTLVEALFRLNRPQFGPPTDDLPEDPFAGWSEREVKK